MPEDLDEGYLDYYFYLLAVLMIFNIILLQYLSKDYRYVTQEELADLDEVLPLTTGDTISEQNSNSIIGLCNRIWGWKAGEGERFSIDRK